MKTLKNLLPYLIISIFLSSCFFKKNSLVGTWEFVNVYTEKSSEEDNYSDFRSFITFSGDKTFFFVNKGQFDPINIFDFIDENSITNKNAKVYYGNWFVKDSIIYFDIQNYKIKSGFSAKIISCDGKNMSITFPKQTPLPKNEEPSKFKYRKIDYDNVSRSKYNFASQELNRWRTKSNKKQSKQELKSTLENVLEFAVSFLKNHEEDNKAATIYYLEPLPFKIYSNGIILKPQDENESWNDLFYDNEDAATAYSMIKDGFKSVAKIPENISKNPIKINIFILEETLKNLKEVDY